METQSAEEYQQEYQQSLPGQPEDTDLPNISQQPPPGVSQRPSSASVSQHPSSESVPQQPPPASGSQMPPPASGSQMPPPASGFQQPQTASGSQLPPIQNGYQKSPLPQDDYHQPPPAGVYHQSQPGGYNIPPHMQQDVPPPAHPQQGWNPPPPQHHGYVGVPPPYSHTNTTVVVQPMVQQHNHHMFREIGVQIVCPHCSQTMTTATRTDIGLITWVACIFICLIGGFAGCFLIPFCLDGTKDIIHSCPLCRKAVGRFARM